MIFPIETAPNQQTICDDHHRVYRRHHFFFHPGDFRCCDFHHHCSAERFRYFFAPHFADDNEVILRDDDVQFGVRGEHDAREQPGNDDDSELREHDEPATQLVAMVSSMEDKLCTSREKPIQRTSARRCAVLVSIPTH